jgi:hypothetical protein
VLGEAYHGWSNVKGSTTTARPNKTWIMEHIVTTPQQPPAQAHVSIGLAPNPEPETQVDETQVNAVLGMLQKAGYQLVAPGQVPAPGTQVQAPPPQNPNAMSIQQAQVAVRSAWLMRRIAHDLVSNEHWVKQNGDVYKRADAYGERYPDELINRVKKAGHDPDAIARSLGLTE